MGAREKDDDYLKRGDFNLGIETILLSLKSLEPKRPEHFAQLETLNFPQTVDLTKTIPHGTKTIIFFPKQNSVAAGLRLLFNNQLYFEVGTEFPYVIRVLPEWKLLTIPASQPSQISGQCDYIFSTHDYEDGAGKSGILRDGTNPNQKLSISSQGAASVSITGSLANIKIVQATSSTTVAVGGNETIQFIVPSGKKWTTLGLGFSINGPVGSTTGSHLASFQLISSSLVVEIAKISQAYNARIQYTASSFFSTVTNAYSPGTVVPDDHVAQANIFKNLILTANTQFGIQYVNNTDQPQTAARTFNLVVLEENIS